MTCSVGMLSSDHLPLAFPLWPPTEEPTQGSASSGHLYAALHLTGFPPLSSQPCSWNETTMADVKALFSRCKYSRPYAYRKMDDKNFGHSWILWTIARAHSTFWKYVTSGGWKRYCNQLTSQKVHPSSLEDQSAMGHSKTLCPKHCQSRKSSPFQTLSVLTQLWYTWLSSMFLAPVSLYTKIQW